MPGRGQLSSKGGPASICAFTLPCCPEQPACKYLTGASIPFLLLFHPRCPRGAQIDQHPQLSTAPAVPPENRAEEEGICGAPGRNSPRRSPSLVIIGGSGFRPRRAPVLAARKPNPMDRVSLALADNKLGNTITLCSRCLPGQSFAFVSPQLPRAH